LSQQKQYGCLASLIVIGLALWAFTAIADPPS
jgi:hypothetical protein